MPRCPPGGMAVPGAPDSPRSPALHVVSAPGEPPPTAQKPGPEHVSSKMETQ